MNMTKKRSDQQPVQGHEDDPRTAPRQNSEHGFAGSKELGTHLQAVLVDLIGLSLQCKQAHWNVVGHNFRDAHLQLDEITVATRGYSDVVAERMRALHLVPDGRSTTLAAESTLQEFPGGEVDTAKAIDLITARLETTVATLRAVHDSVDAEDPTTADILHTIIESLEQFAWMVSSENRRA